MVIKRIITISIKNVTGKVPELLLTRKTINLLVIWREWLNFQLSRMTSNKINIICFPYNGFSQCHENGCKAYKSQSFILFKINCTILVWKHGLCHDMKEKIKQRASKLCGLVKIKKQKYIKSFSYILIQFDSYRREADTPQNKNVFKKHSNSTHHFPTTSVIKH